MQSTKEKIKNKLKSAFPGASKKKIKEVANKIFNVCEEHHKETLKEICR